MTHVMRIDEMLSRKPLASEVYDEVSDSPRSSFVIDIKKDGNNGRDSGYMRFVKPSDKIVELTYDKKSDRILSVIMYNDTTNAGRRFAKEIRGIETKTSGEIASEILDYLLGARQTGRNR